MTYNCSLEMAKLYKKYLKYCQRNSLKPLPKNSLSINMLNAILNLTN